MVAKKNSGASQLKKSIFIGVIVLAFIAALWFGLLKLNEQRALSSAQQYVNQIINGDSAEAYAASSPAIRKTLTLEQFNDGMKAMAAQNTAYISENVQIHGATATYAADISGFPALENGRTDGVFVLTLVRSGISWKVDSINIT